MVGCATLLLVAGLVIYQYRAQIAGPIRSVREDGGADVLTVGAPSDGALRSARRKDRSIGERGGPVFVVLRADEMASLMWDGLDPAARIALAIRAFPCPQAVVPRLVNRLTGHTDGHVPLAVRETVGDVWVRPGGVTFYRRTD